MPRCLSFWSPFLDRALIDFDSQLGPPGPSKSWFSLRENDVFSKNACWSKHRFRSRFWLQDASILLPQTHQNPSKNRSREASTFKSIWKSIFTRLGLLPGSQEGPKTAPRGCQDGPKMAPRTLQKTTLKKDLKRARNEESGPAPFPPPEESCGSGNSS